MLLDIDHFKKLNDQFGHQAGDAALRELGDCLRRVCAERVGCVAARYGGEEFTVAAAGISAPELERLAEALRSEISRIRAEFHGQRIMFTASIGLAHGFPTRFNASALQEIVGAADAALYEAKASGRNCIRLGRGSDASGLLPPAMKG
jgi:diguanylate cyclase